MKTNKAFRLIKAPILFTLLVIFAVGVQSAAASDAEASNFVLVQTSVCAYAGDGVSGVAGATVSYDVQSFGVTGPDGCVSASIPAGEYVFRLDYGTSYEVKTQDIERDPAVVFQLMAPGATVLIEDEFNAGPLNESLWYMPDDVNPNGQYWIEDGFLTTDSGDSPSHSYGPRSVPNWPYNGGKIILETRMKDTMADGGGAFIAMYEMPHTPTRATFGFGYARTAPNILGILEAPPRDERLYINNDGGIWHRYRIEFLPDEIFLMIDGNVVGHFGSPNPFVGVNFEISVARNYYVSVQEMDIDYIQMSHIPDNQPPVCSNAVPSVDTLWPPNHQFAPIDVLGVTDPDGDPISITIDSIFQDEPVDSNGDGSFVPDGQGVGTPTAEVRAERDGSGNGRFYHIGFTADDGRGGTCSGVVLVGVPKSQGKNGAPVDDGPLYDSTSLAP